MVVCGTKGSVELKPLELYEVLPEHWTGVTEYLNPDLPWNDTGVYHNTQLYDRYDNMMASFRRMALGEVQNPWSYDYELALFRILWKCCGNEC